MFDVLKNYLESGDYTVTDGQRRIDYAVARGRITPEQAAELAAIVEQRGTPEAITPRTLDERVSDIEMAIIDLADMVAELVGGSAENTTDETAEETEGDA